MKFREAPKAFKFAGIFQIMSMLMIWGVVMLIGGENQSLMKPLALTAVGAQVLAALAVFIGLTSQDVLRVYMPRKL